MVSFRGVVWVGLLVVGCGVGQAQLTEAPAEAAVAPPPRAARLTYVAEGVVTVSPADGSAGVAAVENMPLTEGMRLTAAESGQAEVEFEDGSIVRMTPNSVIRLNTLGIDADGKPKTVVAVLGGLVYVEARASSFGSFRVVALSDSFWPVENATVRVNMDEPPAVLSVLDGKIRVEHVAMRPSAADSTAQSDVAQSINGYLATVRAGESIRSDVTDGTRYFLSDRIASESWDNWNEGRDQAALDQVATATSVRDNYAGSEGYGWADLDANGTWYDQGAGAAPLWQPTEALQVGFDPYGAGNWSYVAGFGYGWASGYRWGWTPFRCGRWWYYDGFGWAWQPDAFCRSRWGYGGGHFGGYVARAPKGYVLPIKPIRHPGPVHPIIVKGPSNGPHPPYERPRGPRHEPVAMEIAGVHVKPIEPSGHPYTPRGGSAVGWGLKRDYAIDTKTKAPDVGTSSTPVTPVTLSSGPGWHAVSTRPEPQPAGGGGFRGLFHSSKPQETPVVMDRRGNPVVPEVRREQNRQAEFHNEQRNSPAQHDPGHSNPGQPNIPGSTPVRSNAIVAPARERMDAPRSNPAPAQAPRVESHSYSAPAAPHVSAPPPSAPAPSAPASSPAPAAASHK